VGITVNPFSKPQAVENSSYSAYDGNRLIKPDTGERMPAMPSFVHDGLRALILNEHFPCVGGKSAIRHGAYRFGLYPELGTAAAAAGLARDLFTFVEELPTFGESFTTFLASFAGPQVLDEPAFETSLWRTLQDLHDLDADHHEWDPSVSADPDDRRFSFSFGGTAFFVIGLHAGSSRVTRRFAWPTLVFNPHRQFDHLREIGEFKRFQEIIRRGDRALQGDSNPMLADHGEQSEAAQYSGQQIDGAWTCPFHHHPANDPPAD
jgi:FPC/CPF motif-containing protein YcgG